MVSDATQLSPFGTPLGTTLSKTVQKEPPRIREEISPPGDSDFRHETDKETGTRGQEKGVTTNEDSEEDTSQDILSCKPQTSKGKCKRS